MTFHYSSEERSVLLSKFLAGASEFSCEEQKADCRLLLFDDLMLHPE